MVWLRLKNPLANTACAAAKNLAGKMAPSDFIAVLVTKFGLHNHTYFSEPIYSKVFSSNLSSFFLEFGRSTVEPFVYIVRAPTVQIFEQRTQHRAGPQRAELVGKEVRQD